LVHGSLAQQYIKKKLTDNPAVADMAAQRHTTVGDRLNNALVTFWFME